MNLKSKTSEAIERGKAERGNFQPRAGSVPVRLYNYWLKNTNTDKGEAIREGTRSENFCHYWRVVAFWAPFMWFRGAAANFFADPVTIIGMVGIALAGLVAGFIVFDGFFIGFLTFMAGLLAIGVGVVALACAGIFVEYLLTEKFPHAGDKVQSFFTNFWTWVVIVGGFLSMIVVGTSWGTGWTGPIVWTLIFATLGAILYFGGKWIDYSAGQAAIRQAEWDALGYKEQLEILDYLQAINTRKPGRVSKFFSGVGDFVVFIAQVVRVNKWKICPLVDVNSVTK